MKLSERYAAALQFCHERHGDMERKGFGTPFMAHLMSVSCLTLEYGGDETDAIAALLHDTIEDAGGLEAEEAIRARFGDQVAAIVRAVSDADTVPKPPWRERKQAYLDHLAEVDERALLVSAADKLHNVRSLVDEHYADGAQLWDRFNAPKADQLWVYGAYLDAFERRAAALGLPAEDRRWALLGELRRTWEAFVEQVRHDGR